MPNLSIISFRRVYQFSVSFLYLIPFNVLCIQIRGKMSSWKNNQEIEIFREYLRIPSVHPDIDYSKYKMYVFHLQIRKLTTTC